MLCIMYAVCHACSVHHASPVVQSSPSSCGAWTPHSVPSSTSRSRWLWTTREVRLEETLVHRRQVWRGRGSLVHESKPTACTSHTLDCNTTDYLRVTLFLSHYSHRGNTKYFRHAHIFCIHAVPCLALLCRGITYNHSRQNRLSLAPYPVE